MAEPDWNALVVAADARSHGVPIRVDVHHGSAGAGGSEPQRMSSPSDEYFAVKLLGNPQGARILFNEQVVGRLAALLGAPCPEVALIDVEDALAATIRFSSGNAAQGGIAHGSRWLESVAPGSGPASLENAIRHADLAVLYAVVLNTDPQWVSDTDHPFRVYSVDHGHALTGSGWTEASLDSHAAPTGLNYAGGACDRAHLSIAGARLRSIDDSAIASTVAGLPSTWGVALHERIAVCHFLRRQVNAVIAILPP